MKPVKTDENKKQASILFSRQLAAEAMTATEALHEAGQLDAEFMQMAFAQARNWHVTGFTAEQKRLCVLVVHYIPGHYEAMHLLGFQAQTEGDYTRAESF